MFIKKKKYEEMLNDLQVLYDVIYNRESTYGLINLSFDEIKVEAGLIVNTSNPNYEEIKELSKRGDLK